MHTTTLSLLEVVDATDEAFEATEGAVEGAVAREAGTGMDEPAAMVERLVVVLLAAAAFRRSWSVSLRFAERGSGASMALTILRRGVLVGVVAISSERTRGDMTVSLSSSLSDAAEVQDDTSPLRVGVRPRLSDVRSRFGVPAPMYGEWGRDGGRPIEYVWCDGEGEGGWRWVVGRGEWERVMVDSMRCGPLGSGVYVLGVLLVLMKRKRNGMSVVVVDDNRKVWRGQRTVLE